MRGKFNTTVDVYKGPGSGSPGMFVGTFPCKLVREDAIATDGLGAPIISWYLTIDAYLPIGSWSFPSFGLDTSLADRLAVPSGVSPQFWVLYTDVVRWHALTPYYRSYLVMLPVPPPAGSGGAVCDGSAVWFFVFHPAISGGVEVGGSAHRMVAKHFVGQGGVELDGSPAWATRHVFVGRGGTECDGGGVYNTVHKFTSPSGGVECDGQAVITIHIYGSSSSSSSSSSTSSGSSSSSSGGWILGGTVQFSEQFTPIDVSITPNTFGLHNGDLVMITGATAEPNINGIWTITVSDSSHVILLGSTGVGGTFIEPSCFWYHQ